MGGDASAPLSATPTHGMYWLPGKTTDACRPSRSGMTYAPSTDDRGEAVLTWCLADSRAKTLAPPGRAPGSTAPVRDCGEKWPESSGRYDPDTRSWKTRQHSLLGGLEVFSETWPRWGTMRGGEWWERTTPEHLTGGNESGSWLTPTVKDCNTDGPKAIDAWREAMKEGKRPATTYQRLRNQVVARSWPSPTCQDAKNNGAPSQMVRNTKPLNAEVGGPLNPTWVEWLMGWPLGWTDCAVSATAKFRQWCDSHGTRWQR